MATAGKQALAEVSGEPHQTEIFQNTQASDAAKKIFGRSKYAPTLEPAEVASPLEFVIIYFMAPRSQFFMHLDLFPVLENLGLTLTSQNVFEYTENSEVIFYVTSAVKPGPFEVKNPNAAVPGISFILDLKTAVKPQAAFKIMLALLHKTSEQLKGDILDEHRQRLTQGSIHEYLARIKAL